ncbi:MAG: ABC transporter permease [Myxococcales bacterium]|nr:MAG: ABC transporter permease [Myxococcales bacterium]
MSPGLLRYLVGRVVRALLTVIGLVTLVFLLVRLIPGDPVEAILGDQAGPEEKAELRRALNLDRPVGEQYVAFLGDMADGSMGTSFRQPDRSVWSLMRDVLPYTIVLAIAALLVAWIVAVPLGTVAAARVGRGWDKAASAAAVLGLAIPNIWLGPLLILAFGVKLRWLPLPGDDLAGPEALILPAITIGTALAAVLTRQTRAAMIEVLSQQYISAARARGVPSIVLLLRHALRNALLPVMTIGAAQLGALLSGTVVTEKIFERPGLGTLFLDAFFARDIPVVQGCVLVIAVIYVGVNLVVDLAYGVVDPRVRLS